MRKALRNLLTAVPPPAHPVDGGTDEGWRAAENELGLTFPDDYKHLIDHFGSGWWGGRILMLSPFSPNRYINQREIVRGHLFCTEEPDPPSTDPAFLQAWNAIRGA